jgi:hypothetical protein
MASHSWTLGSHNFKSYEHDSIGKVTNLTTADRTGDSISWAWCGQGTRVVTDSCTVSYKGVSLGNFAPTKTLTLEQPEWQWSLMQASMDSARVNWGLASNGNPLLLDPSGSVQVGIVYYFSAKKCPHFPGGTVFCAQMINAWWFFDGTILDRWTGTVGPWDLDTSYPYNATSGVYSVFSPQSDTDTPAYWFTQPGTASVTTSFQIVMMYSPADYSGYDVPLAELLWYWDGDSSSPSDPPSPSLGSQQGRVVHPEWTNVFTP